VLSWLYGDSSPGWLVIVFFVFAGVMALVLLAALPATMRVWRDRDRGEHALIAGALAFTVFSASYFLVGGLYWTFGVAS
jgi:hypothetical protein